MTQHILETEWLTTRDVTLVPGRGQLDSRTNASIHRFIYSAPMNSVTGYDLAEALIAKGEIAVISRFISEEEKEQCIRKFAGRSDVFYAIGFEDLINFNHKTMRIAQEEDWPLSQKINVALDVAHGDMVKSHEATNFLASLSQVGYIMSGSICTEDAALRAVEAGCTHLRIGVGPGAACTTRLMTGVGLPQLSAVYKIYQALKPFPEFRAVQLIADGGIKTPGDAVKYLAAGANGIMIGHALSRTRESLGWEARSNRLWKSYQGQASAAFQHSRYGKENHCPEGASSPDFYWDGITMAGTVIDLYRGGLRSAISYLGLYSLTQLNPENVTFVKVTSSGYQEGTPHGV